MKSKVTLKQLAKELGVSVSTVSKALSNSEEISTQTKLKIKEFATLKKYKPNTIAKNLKNQSSKTIGVIIPNILNPFFAKVFSGIEKRALDRGYNIITGISNESFEKEKQVMELLNNGSIDGFIVSVAEESQTQNKIEHFNDAINSGTPIVMFDRVAKDVVCDKVVVDDFDSAFFAATHLINIGCKNIAVLSTINGLSVGKLRLNGYESALENKSMPNDVKNHIIESDLDLFDEKLAALLNDKSIDGIFAIDEHAATMSHKTALKKGFKIPDQLNLIGFADGAWSRRLTPSLSTVSQHAPEIGECAANLLIDRLEKPFTEFPKYETIVIKTELRYRESTKR